jgi:hypothetical protein
MSKLSTKARKALPKKEFAGPGRSFPINDKKHARLAISGATRSENVGNISKKTANRIKAKARAKLGKEGDRKEGEHLTHTGKRQEKAKMDWSKE